MPIKGAHSTRHLYSLDRGDYFQFPNLSTVYEVIDHEVSLDRELIVTILNRDTEELYYVNLDRHRMGPRRDETQTLIDLNINFIAKRRR